LANTLSCGLIMLASGVRGILFVATIVANPCHGGYFLLTATDFFTVP